MSALPSERGWPVVIAHRGASAHRPENTMPAYALAIEQRADMIEIDLHHSSDGAIPIAHDAKLEHYGRAGEIGDLTRAEIDGIDAGEGLPIPELAAVLDAYGRDIPFNLEIKAPDRGPYAGLEAQALGLVRQRGLLGRTLWSSFSDAVLGELRRLDAKARLAVLVSPAAPEQIFERAAAVSAEAVNPHYLLVTADLVAEAHDRRLGVFPYTVDDPDDMERLLALGVDGLFTNWPDRMRGLVDARRVR